jgi:vacuolar-type H+-ATPase subunit B/Vma2
MGLGLYLDNFHKIANGRKRKNTVISLEKGEIIEGDDKLLKHATEYYSELFGPGENHNIHIDQRL